MFQLTKEEFDNLLFQIGRASWGGRRTPPRAFTEQGVAMLSGVLHSERAININIHIIIAEEIIISKIYGVRGKQVMLSHDLAELYQVETRVINQQVNRNIGRFPERYMFQLTQDEYDRLRSQNVILKRGQHIKYLPYAFTEHGILMLSSVLKSERAEKVNVLIIDTFIKIREILFMHKDVVHQLELVKNKLSEHDGQIIAILEYLNQFEKAKQEVQEHKDRPRIGFKP